MEQAGILEIGRERDAGTADLFAQLAHHVDRRSDQLVARSRIDSDGARDDHHGVFQPITGAITRNRAIPRRSARTWRTATEADTIVQVNRVVGGEEDAVISARAIYRDIRNNDARVTEQRAHEEPPPRPGAT